jgi:RimJ/RimL family protein N-acetyltransferase
MPIEVPALTGRYVRLEPLEEAHREPLRAAADDERIWRHMLTVGRGPGFDTWFAEAFARKAIGSRVPFAVRRLADGAIVGSTSYLDPALPHRRVEIGSTWYRPNCWGTAINPECKLLLLAHTFDVLGMNRVQFITDRLNERSQAAIARLGAVREGVLRSHMVAEGGRTRDSVMFSITSNEWPAVRELLTTRLTAMSH